MYAYTVEKTIQQRGDFRKGSNEADKEKMATELIEGVSMVRNRRGVEW
jgi:hypothetical protein